MAKIPKCQTFSKHQYVPEKDRPIARYYLAFNKHPEPSDWVPACQECFYYFKGSHCLVRPMRVILHRKVANGNS